MPISSALGSSALLPAGLGHRNKFINGDMRIAQRGTAVITGSGSAQYPVDRWVVYNGTGTVTFAQSTVAPAGFTNSLNATVTATGSYSTAGYTEIRQSIEGFNCQDLAWGTASAKPITISFWVRSSVVGTYNVAIQNSGQNRTYVASFSILVANTWEYKTIQIAGDITGTWLVDNSVGLHLWFQLGMGSNYDTTGNTWVAGNLGSTSGAIDFAANSGATFYLTGVQLEQNYQPTPFEQRPIGVELALCQRYYCTVADGAFATNLNVGLTHYYQAGFLVARCSFPVSMRSNAITLVATSGTNYYINYSNNNGGDGFNSWTLNVVNFNEALIYNGSEVSGTSGYAGDCRLNNALAKVSFSAEL